MTNAFSSTKALIGYKLDYNPKEEYDKKTYNITGADGVRNYLDVTIADGESIEFLITMCYEKLDDMVNEVPGGWNGVRLFKELQLCLSGRAKDECKDLIARAYPNDADRNAAGTFEELKRCIITKLSDHTYPGDRMYTYLMKRVKYMKCKKEDGRVEEPIKVLARLQRLRKMGAMMHHNQGADYITDDQFTNLYWDIFPEHMQEWLEEGEDKDPFDPANPMDHEDIAGHMQRYWTLNYKRSKQNDDQKNKRKNDDGDESGGSNKRRKGRNHRGGNHGNNRGDKSDDGNGGRNKCPIKGHENYKHSWHACFLNPKNMNGRFDAEAAKKFYDDNARGANVWYREVYEANTNNGGRGGGRRYENNDQGRGGGRGYYQGGRGGRGGYGGRGGRGGGGRGYNNGGRGNYHQNNGGDNQNQGRNDGEGYHYQDQRQEQGYHNGYQYDDQRGSHPHEQRGTPPAKDGASYYNLVTTGRGAYPPAAPPSSYRIGPRRE